MLIVGGVAIGVACGYAASALIGRFIEGELGVAASFLTAWGSYIVGERLGVSGVLATVACGIVMGWRQHASHRRRAAVQVAGRLGRHRPSSSRA